MKTLELLTTESVLELKSISSARPASLIGDDGGVKPLATLVAEFGLTLTQSRFSLDETVSIRIPDGANWSENHDRENSTRIARALAGMSPARATDERIWATLALGEFAEYSNVRRPIDRAKDSDAAIESKFKHMRLASSNRDRWRENPISRLWWLNYYVHSIEGIDPEIVREVLFLNADLQSNLLGRPGVAGYRVVVGPLIEHLHSEHIKNATPFNRDRFREIMKELDFLVGRLAVGAMDKAVASEWVATVIERCN